MSSQRPRPAASNVVVAALAVSLVVLAWLTLSVLPLHRSDPPTPVPDPSGWAPPPRTNPTDTPTPGAGFPVRSLGQIPAAGLSVSGRGNAELRYVRVPANANRIVFTCPTCTQKTWLVDVARPHPLGGGPLADPTHHVDVVDYLDPGPRNSLLVKAPSRAPWTLTLTPFDGLRLQSSTVSERGTAVVRVRTIRPMTLRCAPPSFVKTFTRPPGEPEYGVHWVISEDTEDEVTVQPPKGTDEVVLLISCDGAWTLDPG
jgi:hypothetical protein